MLPAFISYFSFSSRRRHTRWPRDWSSDVCSSDLPRSTGGPTSIDNGQGACAHDNGKEEHFRSVRRIPQPPGGGHRVEWTSPNGISRDRKSTRLNSSHVASSYAVFCLKKKTVTEINE